MKRIQQGFTSIELFIAVLVIGALWGWIWNIVKIAQTPSFENIEPMLILRFIGIPIWFIGSVIGFI